MNRKYNPFVSLVALLLAAIILVLTCTGCVPAAAGTETNPANRFVTEYSEWQDTYGYLAIITDTETGVQYLMVDGAYGCGITVLLPGEE